ncbi:NYN domain-containing protein [Candidatus Nomurabacteria bacterium]|nr:NYN domain-containing protein [Candidatus Nomurabacteria bacterium]
MSTLEEFKKQYIRDDLGITEEFANIFSFIDFGNVNNWFEEDRQDYDNNQLDDNQKIVINLEGLKRFADIFSSKVRNYYGYDPNNLGSKRYTYVNAKIFGKRNFITKKLQKIKHYPESEDLSLFDELHTDKKGKKYIEIRKSNFDVEMSVDAIKMLKHYDTFCLFSGDSDFTYLNNFLKKAGKRIILIKAGNITSYLRKTADLIINAQRIKKHITKIKTKA